MNAVATQVTGPRLTSAGRAWAEAHPESIIGRVAIQADAGDTDWPEPFRDVAIKLCNHDGEKEGM